MAAIVDHPGRFLGYVRMEADLNYQPGQSLERLYELKPQWKMFQDTPKAIEFLRDAAMVIDRVLADTNSASKKKE